MRFAKGVLGKAIFVLIAVCVLGAGSVTAQDIELIGSYEYQSLKAIAIKDNYAFLSSHVYGSLLILDISDPSNPVFLYEYSPARGGYEFHISGDLLYAACGNGGMDIIDISDPLNINLVTNWTVNSQLNDIYIVDNIVFIAMMSAGLYIVDVSQPGDPVVLGHYPYTNHFHMIHIVVSGDYAYVGGDGSFGWEGIKIFDISNLEDPTVLNEIQMPFPRDLLLRDDMIFIAHNDGLMIVDITDPLSPDIISDLPTDDFSLGLFLEGDLAFVANRFSGMSIVDISDPYNPAFLANYDTDAEAVNVLQNGYYTYLVDEDIYLHPGSLDILWYPHLDSGAVSGIITNEISELLENVAVSVINAPMKDSSDIDGSYLLEGFYTAEYDISFSHSYYRDTVVTGVAIESGLMTYRDVIMGYPPLADVGSSAILSPIDSVLEGAPYYPVTEITNFGYNSQTFDLVFEIYDSQTNDLVFTDITSAYNIPATTIDTITFAESFTPGHATTYDLVSYSVLSGDENALNDTATAVCHSYRIYPLVEEMSATAVSDLVMDVDVSNNYAFLCRGGLNVFDVSDPVNPIAVAALPLDCYSICIEGDYAYLLSNQPTNRLEIVDISDPTDPFVSGFCDIYITHGSPFCDLFVRGDYAYVSDLYYGLQIIDVSDRTNPLFVTFYEPQDDLYSAFVRDDYAYLSVGQYGVEILDISIPENPLFVGSYDTPGIAYRTFVERDYAYVADSSSMQILDISNPSNPIFIGQYDAQMFIYRVIVQPPYAYVLDYNLAVVDILSPQNPVYAAGYSEISNWIWDHFVRGSYIYHAEDNLFRILRFPTSGSGCQYVVGDFNGNLNFNIADVIATFSKLKTGSPEASLLCDCPPGSGDVWAVAMDLNNSCSFNVADVIAGFSKLKTGEPELIPCELCPPGGR
ncbi:MAG: hypothetical protein V3W18_04390 [candidate division Zixibacteria bacterium]